MCYHKLEDKTFNIENMLFSADTVESHSVLKAKSVSKDTEMCQGSLRTWVTLPLLTL